MNRISGSFHHQHNEPNNSNHFLTMKTKNESNTLEHLSLTAVISCLCSVLYFLAANLLA